MAVSQKMYLALDTSGDCLSVALGNNEVGCLAFRNVLREQQNELIPETLEELLQETKLTLESIQGVCFGAGPGSFTGLRIGYAFVQGLCLARHIPAYPINSLERALSSAERLVPGVKLVFKRSRRMEYFTAERSTDGGTSVRGEAQNELFERIRGGAISFLAIGEAEDFDDSCPFQYGKRVRLVDLSLAQSFFSDSMSGGLPLAEICTPAAFSNYQLTYITPVSAKTIEERRLDKST